MQFQKIKIRRVEKLTSDAVSIVLATKGKEEFAHLPGQYLSVRISIDGVEHSRAYSISSSPYVDEDVVISVKKAPNGFVSAYLNQKTEDLQELDVTLPMGEFTYLVSPESTETAVYIGAGSGITPLISMIRSQLDQETQSRAVLVFGNRNEDSIMFSKTFEALKAQFVERLEVRHCLSQPSAGWQGAEGRLTEDKIEEILKEFSSEQISKAYLCGPEGMMRAAESTLGKLASFQGKVFKEHFTKPGQDVEKQAGSKQESQISVCLNGKQHDLKGHSEETLLDWAMPLGPPFSCRYGQCKTCRAKLVEGKVRVDDDSALAEEEKEAGVILTCQSYPDSEKVVVDFDADLPDATKFF